MSADADSEIVAMFRVFTRCHNCRGKSERIIEVPNVEDAPTDVESLLESAFLQRQTFKCAKCENPIATVIGVNCVPMAA